MGRLFRFFSAVDFKQVFDPKQDETIPKKDFEDTSRFPEISARG